MNTLHNNHIVQTLSPTDTNDLFNIDYIKINDTWFKTELIKILETNRREDAYQAYIIYPILECVLKKISRYFFGSYELIDTHAFKQRNTKEHDRSYYSSLAMAVPDLIIAEDFLFYNRIEDHAKYAIAVEIKEVNSPEMLNKSFDKKNMYDLNLLIQLLPQLWKNQSVILTNLRVWEFIKIKNKNNFDKNICNYMKIIGICGIDSSTIDLNSKYDDLNKLISNLDNYSFTNDIKELSTNIQNASQKDKIAFFDLVVQLASKTFEDSIRNFYLNSCEVETVKLLDEKKYISDFNIKRHFQKYHYISDVSDISFCNNVTLHSLMVDIESFIHTKLKCDTTDDTIE